MSLPFAPTIAPIGWGLDKSWVMTSTGFVLLMQVGLGLLEYGSVRRKNSRIVWYKILLNIINAFWWWFILGFAWAFGNTNGAFLGAQIFYAGGQFNEPFNQALNGAVPFDNVQGPGYNAQWAHFVWRVAEALVATTIATGIITERITMRGVFVFNLAFNMIILPFVFAWTYAFGFLVDDIGYRDYAGCFIIFGVGAFAGLAGLLLIKARYNRYQKFPVVLLAGPGVVGGPIVGDARPHSGVEGQRNLPSVAFDKVNQPTAGAYGPTTSGVLVPGASSTAFTIDNVVRVRARINEDVYENFGVTDYGLVSLGAIIFFIGFLFFCGGASQGLQATQLYQFAETSFANAAVAGPAAGLVTAIAQEIFARRRPVREKFATVARAFVAGLVCVAADPEFYRLWAGFVIGMIGALSYVIMKYWFFHLKLDDPADFFAMFGAPAISGLICSAFFNMANGIWYTNAAEGEVLIWQLLSMAILAGWTFIIALITFGILKLFKALRIGVKTEIIGYDYIDGGKHLDYPDKGIETLEKERVK